MSFAACLVVMVGGALGTLARYVVSMLMSPVSRELPWGTILINLSGSFLIGFFGTLTLASGRYPAPENLRLFVMVGFCGGFTTFSAFSLQTLDLLRSGAFGRAAINVVGSIVVCILAVAAGHAIAAYFNEGAAKIAQLEIEEDA
jgi:CrcB protein